MDEGAGRKGGADVMVVDGDAIDALFVKIGDRGKAGDAVIDEDDEAIAL